MGTSPEAARPREGGEGQDWEQHISGPPHGHAWELHSSFSGQEARGGGVASFVGQHTILGGGAPPWCLPSPGVGRPAVFPLCPIPPGGRGRHLPTSSSTDSGRTLSGWLFQLAAVAGSETLPEPAQRLASAGPAYFVSCCPTVPSLPHTPHPMVSSSLYTAFQALLLPIGEEAREGPGQHAHV